MIEASCTRRKRHHVINRRVEGPGGGVSRSGSGSLVDGNILRKTRFRAVRRPNLSGKSLILRDTRVQIPYAAEQGNKSDEQGDKIDDQGIKSAEHGKARQVSSGRRRRPAGARCRQTRAGRVGSPELRFPLLRVPGSQP